MFEEFYLEWINDFLSIQGMARYYNMKPSGVEKRINIGRKIHNQRLTR